ncbi:MAG: excinuclease ABC subunit UvrC, partial [Acidobacteriota bacterium]
AAPCVRDLCSEQRYQGLVDEARQYLEGRGADLKADLERKMHEAADAKQYERAGHYRDLLESVRLTGREQKVATTGLQDRDLFALHRRGEKLALQVFLVRRGIVVERKQFFWDNAGGLPDEELLSTFLQQYYDGEQLIPPEICVPFDVLEKELLVAWLRQLRGGAVRIHRPQRGAKKRLLDLVTENARLALANRFDPSADVEAARILQELLHLDSPPQLIECVDVSHTQAGETVAGLVRFRGGVADKSGYRRFRLQGLLEPDDVRSIAQATRRHYRRLVDAQGEPPDLLLVDGGRGQLNAAARVLEELGMPTQPLAAIAKVEEKLYLRGRRLPILLARHPPVLRLVQRVRDEAHRFALSYHRALRRRRVIGSILEQVPGIGSARRKALLNRFGSVAGVRRATAPELAEEVGARLAKRLKAYLQEGTVE